VGSAMWICTDREPVAVADGVTITAEALGSLYEDQSFRVNISYFIS
jgi:hypothetical protein